MTWTSLSIMLAIGALHSASLWLVTLAAKRAGLDGRMLRVLPLLLGVPSAYIAFPVACKLVLGIDIDEPIFSAALGLPAAAGAEAVYRVAAATIPKITDALVGRLSGGDDK